MTTYDSSVYSFTVNVTDNKGTLVSAIDGVSDISFTNEYTAPSEVTGKYASISINKEVSGLDKTDKSFTFDITDYNGTVTEKTISMSDSNSKNGTFTALISTAGDHYFEITEKDPEYDGYSSDDTVYLVNVKTEVTKEVIEFAGTDIYKKNADGTKTLIEENASDPEVTFTNVYAPEPVTASFDVQKIVSSTDEKPIEDKTFEFQVGDEKFTVPANSTQTYTFTQKFAEGEYDFTLKETDLKYSNYSFSNETYNVHVSVTRDNDTLSSKTTVTDAKGKTVSTAAFTNVYQYSIPYETYSFGIAKEISGLDKTDKTFAFNVVKNDGSSEGKTVSVENSNKGSSDFEAKINTAGDHYYEITEKDSGFTGYTTDKSDYLVNIRTVKDGLVIRLAGIDIYKKNTDGTKTLIEENASDPVVTFTNVYTPEPVTASFDVQKIVSSTDEEPVEDKTFEFQVGDEKFTVPANSTQTYTFAQKFAEGEYDFTLKETDLKYSNYSFSNETYNVHVSVLRDNDTLSSKTTVTDAKGETVSTASFTNVYQYSIPSETYSFRIVKNIEGLDTDSKIFKFLISLDTGFYTDQYIHFLNAKTSYIDFNARINTPGDHYYDISEYDMGFEGYTTDTSEYLVNIRTVKDGLVIKLDGIDIYKKNTDGTKTLIEENASDPEVTFTNVYTPEPVTASFDVQKIVSSTDEEPIEDKTFEFHVGDEKFTVPANSTQTYTFAQKFAEGEYDFTLKETDLKYNSYSFSNETYNVHVSVTRDNKTLSSKTTVTNSKGETVNTASFTNIYQYSIPYETYKIGIAKEIDGLDETDRTFTFNVVRYDGTSEEKTVSVENSNKGSSDFEAKINTAGDHYYEITEKDSGYTGYTTDVSDYLVNIRTVKDGLVIRLAGIDIYKKNTDGTKTLIEENASDPVVTFTNVYTPEPVTASFDVQKIVKYTDDKPSAGEIFEFQVGDEKFTVPADSTQTYTFTQKFVEGEYDFTLKETDLKYDYYNFSNEVYNVHVSVTKDKENLVSSTVIKDSEGNIVDTAVFTNIYQYKTPDEEIISSSFSIGITKKISGLDSASKSFIFTVEKAGGASSDNEIVIKNSNEGNTEYSTEIKDSGNHYYEITEKDMGYQGYTTDKTDYVVNIRTEISEHKVILAGYDIYKKNTDGIMTLVEENADKADLVFVNTYTPESVTASFSIQKIVSYTDEKPSENKVFEFQVGAEKFTVPADSTQTYTFAHRFAEGEYDFTLKETDLKYSNYSFSNETYNVHVSVTRNNDTLSSKTTITNSKGETVNTAVFTNVYNYKTVKTVAETKISPNTYSD